MRLARDCSTEPGGEIDEKRIVEGFLLVRLMNRNARGVAIRETRESRVVEEVPIGERDKESSSIRLILNSYA